MSDYHYIGVGKVYMREYGASAGLIHVGNVSALAVAISEESKKAKDYTKGGGGTANEVRRVDAATMSMTWLELSPSNLSKALFGTTGAIAAGTVTDEVITAYVGALVPTAYPIDTTVDPVVTNSGGGTTYIKDTDYTVTAAGIEIPSSGSAITDAQSLKIDYTKKAATKVEALLNSAKEYEIYFAGLNEARSGKATNVRFHRCRIGAAKNLELIGEDFAGLEVEGELLKDTTKNGTTISQYFVAQVVD